MDTYFVGLPKPMLSSWKRKDTFWIIWASIIVAFRRAFINNVAALSARQLDTTTGRSW